MKKGTKTLAAAALAISALTPVAAASAATTSIEPGVYTSTNYYSITDFKKLSTADKAAALTSPGAVVVVNGTAFTGANVLTASDLELPTLGTPADTYTTAAGNKLVSGQKLDATTTPAPVETAVASVSAINATTVEVTFNNALAAVPAASEFSIPGIEVKSAAFKPETDNKVVVLTTSTQSAQNYTLTYAGKGTTFVGKTNLGSVLLTAAKYEVEIVPSKNQLTPVEITAQLAGFPEGAEAVIEFTTSFGKVVKVQTTQNGKAVFQLTPLETLNDQTAVVTGQVVEVKNPTTGQTYPQYKNSSVGSVNVKFVIKDTPGTDTIQSFKVNTAYADQADRVYMKIGGGVTGKIQNALNYQPETLIKNTTSATKKEMYRYLHDALFTQISSVVTHGATVTSADVTTIKTNLKTALNKANGSAITATDLRNLLYNNAINEAYGTVYSPLLTGNEKAKKDALVAEIQSITDAELNGILEYYRLLSKFVILDNIKDTSAPQNPDKVFAVEHIYAEGDALVLVLPTDRSSSSKNNGVTYEAPSAADSYSQARTSSLVAKFLKDNASHQILFVNDTDKDRYEITGDPTFKLEDATSLKLIAVREGRYKVRSGTATTPSTPGALSCSTPVVFDSTGSTSGLNTGGGSTPSGTPTFNSSVVSGVLKTTPVNYTIDNVYRPYTNPYTLRTSDKLGELRVVFSESVSLSTDTTNNSILNLNNWAIDGVSLKRIADDFGAHIDIRVDSTDPTKQLRDVAVITFVSKQEDPTQATKQDVRSIERFLEKVTTGQHKLEVSNIGDWAGETDSRNIVPSQALDFAGLQNATAWDVAGQSTTTTSADAARLVWNASNAFITRAIATPAPAGNTTSNDVIQIVFSEPMKLDGTDSILEKANYRLDGLELPAVGSSIKRGIETASGEFKDSDCAVTIELPNGYLQRSSGSSNISNISNMLTVSNVKGYTYSGATRAVETTALDERVQMNYARQITIIPTAGTITVGGTVVNGRLEQNTIPLFTLSNGGTFKVESKVYTVNGQTVNVNGWYNAVGETIFTSHPSSSY